MRTFISIMLSIVMFTQCVFANSQASQASNVLHIGASDIMSGSMKVLTSASELSVISVKSSSEVVIALLQDTASGAQVSVRFTKESLGNLSIQSGKTIQMVASTAGIMMMLSGKLLGIIPNEVGQSLLYSSQEQ